MIGLSDKVYWSKFHSQVTTNGLATLPKRQQEGKAPGVHENSPGLAGSNPPVSPQPASGCPQAGWPQMPPRRASWLFLEALLGTPTLKYTCFSAKPPPEGSRQVTLGALREPTMTAVVEAWRGVDVGPQNSAKKSWEEKSLEHR